MDLETQEPSQETAQDPPKLRLLLGLGVVIGGLLFSGVAHGYLDGRWGVAADVQQRGSRLLDLPESCGDWRVAEVSELDAGAQALLRCHGSLVREYVRDSTGDHVTVAVLYGPRGPIAVHTPEICYSSIGTQQIGSTTTELINVGDQDHELWSVQFAERPNPNPTFGVWYAWSDGGPWTASKYPRFWLTDHLFKIQVAGPLGSDPDDQPCRDFLTAFLPQLDSILAMD